VGINFPDSCSGYPGSSPERRECCMDCFVSGIEICCVECFADLPKCSVGGHHSRRLQFCQGVAEFVVSFDNFSLERLLHRIQFAEFRFSDLLGLETRCPFAKSPLSDPFEAVWLCHARPAENETRNVQSVGEVISSLSTVTVSSKRSPHPRISPSASAMRPRADWYRTVSPASVSTKSNMGGERSPGRAPSLRDE